MTNTLIITIYAIGLILPWFPYILKKSPALAMAIILVVGMNIDMVVAAFMVIISSMSVHTLIAFGAGFILEFLFTDKPQPQVTETRLKKI